MVDLEKAAAFVRDKGNEVEQARLRYLLEGERPSEEIMAKLLAGQRPDGGWTPFWAGDYSSLDATCFRLAQAEQLGIGEQEAAVARAVGFLGQRQLAEGSWQEEERVADLAPPWARPGDQAARLYLTANCGLWLAVLGGPEEKAMKAAGYLRGYLAEEGHLPGFLHTHWLAGGLWRRVGWLEEAERVFGYLGRRIDDLAVSHLAWLATTMRLAGVSADHPLVVRAVSRLEQGQEEDGRWVSEDGPGQDVHVTLEAMRGIATQMTRMQQMYADFSK